MRKIGAFPWLLLLSLIPWNLVFKFLLTLLQRLIDGEEFSKRDGERIVKLMDIAEHLHVQGHRRGYRATGATLEKVLEG